MKLFLPSMMFDRHEQNGVMIISMKNLDICRLPISTDQGNILM